MWPRIACLGVTLVVAAGSVAEALMVGVRIFRVRASLGLGANVITIESVAGDRGLGLYQPLASANVGFDIYGFRLGGEARVTRRWIIGAPDFT